MSVIDTHTDRCRHSHCFCLGVLDINECSLETDNCDSNAFCTNTEGSFTCTCKSGFQGDGIICTGVYKLHQILLFKFRLKQYCSIGREHVFHVLPVFLQSMFYPSWDSPFSNTDIDECSTGGDSCDLNARCVNNLGGYQCICNPGFSGNGSTCIGGSFNANTWAAYIVFLGSRGM